MEYHVPVGKEERNKTLNIVWSQFITLAKNLGHAWKNLDKAADVTELSIAVRVYLCFSIC